MWPRRNEPDLGPPSTSGFFSNLSPQITTSPNSVVGLPSPSTRSLRDHRRSWTTLPTIFEEDLAQGEVPSLFTPEVLRQARASLQTRRRRPPPKSIPAAPAAEPDPLAVRLRHWLVPPRTPASPPSDHPSTRHRGLAPDLCDND